MKKRNFTLIEIVIGLIILGVIVTVATPLYLNIKEDAKAKDCEIREKVALESSKAKFLEDGQFPGSLSELRREDLERGWAKVLKEEGKWKVKLVSFIVNLDKRGLAYAWVEKYAGDLKCLDCPSDDTPYSAGGISYAINPKVAGKGKAEYEKLSDTEALIFDSDSDDGATVARRHIKHGIGGTSYAIGIDKNHIKRVCTTPTSNQWTLTYKCTGPTSTR